jgi:hypothetical protein
VLAAPCLPNTVTPLDSRNSLQGGRFLHSDREQEDNCCNVQLDCGADRWDWTGVGDEVVRCSTVGRAVELHDVV